ncbi:hypothetical protein Hamer_G021829, partial [Homarus americanus]
TSHSAASTEAPLHQAATAASPTGWSSSQTLEHAFNPFYDVSPCSSTSSPPHAHDHTPSGPHPRTFQPTPALIYPPAHASAHTPSSPCPRVEGSTKSLRRGERATGVDRKTYDHRTRLWTASGAWYLWCVWPTSSG